MKPFKIVPQIEKYDDVVSFLSQYPLSDTDFLFVSKTVYKTFFESHVSIKSVYFRSDYGQGEPTSEMVDALLTDFLKSGCDRIIAIGGGSVMDMAKILAISENADCEKLFLDPINLKHRHPLILVPTTCGSGSEVSNISIVEMLSLKTKLGLAKDELYADKAILIPSLLSSISDFTFKTSAIDGLIHAIESYLSSRSNEYTRLFQVKSIELYVKGFIQLSQGKPKEELFDSFMIASNMAGISFANTGTGCVHGISYPLSGTYHVTHGLANSIFLVEVLKMYDKLSSKGTLEDLKKLMAHELSCDSKDVFETLDSLFHDLLEIPSLKQIGMKEEEIITFSESVIKHQQRLMSNGYVNLNLEQVQKVYQNLYE